MTGARRTWLLAARERVDENYGVVLAVLLVVALAGGWLVYGVHAAPQTTVEERTTATWSETGSVEHGATVQQDTELFDSGERLDDQSVYFTEIAPELDGSFTYGYTAADGSLAVTLETTLVIRSVDDDETLWEIEEPLDHEHREELAPGETATVEFGFDANEIDERVAEIREELGSTPGTVEIAVLVDTEAEGTVEDEPVAHSETHAIPVELAGDTYRVDDPNPIEASHAVTERVETPVEPGPLRSLGSVALLVASLSGLAAVTGGRRVGLLAPHDHTIERAAALRDRDRFDDWITRGSVPNEALDRPIVRVETLADLVDLAIDCDARVIADGEREQYVVLREEAVYVHEPRSWPDQ